MLGIYVHTNQTGLMYRLAAFLAMGAAVLGSIPVVAAADETGGIAGYVVDETTHRPIPGVAIVVVRMTRDLDERAHVLTDRHGFFSDLALAPGRYAITASVQNRSASCIVDDVFGGLVRHVRILIGPSDRDVQCLGPGVRRDIIDPDQTSSIYRV